MIERFVDGDGGDLLTPDEAAELLRISRSTLSRMTVANQIPHMRLPPRCVRYDAKALRAWLDAKMAESTAATGTAPAASADGLADVPVMVDALAAERPKVKVSSAGDGDGCRCNRRRKFKPQS